MSRTITETKVDESQPDGEGFRRIKLSWRNASGDRQETVFDGQAAREAHEVLAVARAIHHAAEELVTRALVIGRIR